MADMLSQFHSSGMERGPLGSSSVRPRPEGDRPSSRVSLHRMEENRVPPALPKAFSSMLKTTTETGDIGMFSIKPPRVPHAPGSPRRINGIYRDNGPQSAQRPRNYQAHGSPGVIDDRRRLPSYSRDATSEVVSLYETASQKAANRVFDEPDYRSYSMNQAYSQYALTNHRSYSSLRSNNQPDGGGNQLQRPRSPFAYPARLKRPGFRPSSPALTDGGLVDYSRRAEIERGSHVARTSSPASVYAQRRNYGLGPLRSNANRSTPSLLSQSSPPRRSVSPLARPDDGTPSSEWLRRYGPASMSSSPARSTLSLASTANPYQVAPVASTTTTPGKPSPLYYDYTEDFDVDDYNRPSIMDPPPQFRIDKTIPEDRPLSANWQKGSNVDACDTRIRSSSSGHSTVIRHKAANHSYSSGPASPHSSNILELEKQHNGSHDQDSRSGESSFTTDKKLIRLSGLGFGAQELSRSVGEAFGLPSTPSFELISADVNGDTNGSTFGNESNLDGGMESESVRTSGYSFNTHLRQFPPPPADGNSNMTSSEPTYVSKFRISSDTFGGGGRGSYKVSPSTSPTRTFFDGAAEHKIQYQSPTGNSRKRSSQSFAVEASGTENTEPTLKRKSTENPGPTNASPLHGPALRLESTVTNVSHGLFGNGAGREDSPLRQQFGRANNESADVPSDTLSTLSHRPSKKRRVDAVSEPNYESDVPNFSHQIPRRLATRSDSPMLAPKPISPARQLKLKNSIPQLMKALPAVPSRFEKPIRTVSPLRQPTFPETQLAYDISPLIQKAGSSDPANAQTTKYNELHTPLSVQPKSSSSGPTELDSRPITSVSTIVEDETEPNVQPAKLKLKTRNSVSLRPISADSRPWNREDSYPWSDPDVEVANPTLSVQDEERTSTKLPKFKLKVTRASNSTMGTVRVNRESSESRSAGGLHLRNPRDLFTTSSGIDNVFSSITKHLHSRKASTASNSPSLDSKALAHPSRSLDEQTQGEQSGRSNISETVPAPAVLANSTHAASFFSDDSIRSHERLNLRKRISNLRSRMITPYASRNAAQSYDDLTWRNREREHAPSPSPTRSHPDLHADIRMSSEPERKKGIAERIRGHNLRTRVSEWLKGAKLAFAAHVKRGVGH